jgi:hypothetical protein
VAIQFSFRTAPPQRWVLENPKKEVRLTDTCNNVKEHESPSNKNRSEKMQIRKRRSFITFMTTMHLSLSHSNFLKTFISKFKKLLQTLGSQERRRRFIRFIRMPSSGM